MSECACGGDCECGGCGGKCGSPLDIQLKLAKIDMARKNVSTLFDILSYKNVDEEVEKKSKEALLISIECLNGVKDI